MAQLDKQTLLHDKKLASITAWMREMQALFNCTEAPLFYK